MERSSEQKSGQSMYCVKCKKSHVMPDNQVEKKSCRKAYCTASALSRLWDKDESIRSERKELRKFRHLWCDKK